ncbi:MAG: bifunctional 5,10-methylenetetrahydrofolate dehydrogenase/5,10-methenyltetrahydrofolate cyclohydrolase [Coriobacteriales bacterium]|jgi:methylenetetrahydrofolate dehydrogenase (NADP+)/methenyltetrahydrofolate cyclohydrolase|nr:bifunctional 5,10-methylenetetrahydrofolate dehydrogenase/5,10-methenyltetrahydrofolate cyclohydrolase [Coriobacteriales bacterium]
MTQILKGSEVADALSAQTAARAAGLRSAGVTPTLAIVRVGERADDISYERGACKRAEKVGVAVRHVLLAADVTTKGLIGQIEALNADSEVHGVLLFRPLPPHIDEDAVRNTLSVYKDVDGISDLSLAGVFSGKASGGNGKHGVAGAAGDGDEDARTAFAPCTPSACMEILEHCGIEVAGKKAVVVGRSLVVGKPAAMMLLDRNATVTVAHSRTKDLPAAVRTADIVIACVGRAAMLGADYLASGQVVIDVGINVTADGSLVGDVERTAAEGTVAALTPVPGGVGAVTTSVLMKHVVQAAQAAQTRH